MQLMMSERRVRWVQKVLWGCHFYTTLHLRCRDTDCFDGVPSVIWQSKYTKHHLLSGLLKSLRSQLWNNTSSLVITAHHGLVALINPNHLESERVDHYIVYSKWKIVVKYYHGAVLYYNEIFHIFLLHYQDPLQIYEHSNPKKWNPWQGRPHQAENAAYVQVEIGGRPWNDTNESISKMNSAHIHTHAHVHMHAHSIIENLWLIYLHTLKKFNDYIFWFIKNL